MKEATVWASVIAALALLCLVLPPEAVLGTFTLLAFVGWIACEFWNIHTWIIARLVTHGEREPNAVDWTLGVMYGHENEYGATRNAKQKMGG